MMDEAPWKKDTIEVVELKLVAVKQMIVDLREYQLPKLWQELPSYLQFGERIPDPTPVAANEFSLSPQWMVRFCFPLFPIDTYVSLSSESESVIDFGTKLIACGSTVRKERFHGWIFEFKSILSEARWPREIATDLTFLVRDPAVWAATFDLHISKLYTIFSTFDAFLLTWGLSHQFHKCDVDGPIPPAMRVMKSWDDLQLAVLNIPMFLEYQLRDWKRQLENRGRGVDPVATKRNKRMLEIYDAMERELGSKPRHKQVVARANEDDKIKRIIGPEDVVVVEDVKTALRKRREGKL